jgi:uncharacterized membrane protein YhaH (DUF805 family)
MSLIDLIDTFVRLRGRLRRRAFLGYLFLACTVLPGMAYLGLVMTRADMRWFPFLGVILVATGLVGFPLSIVALLAKRLHDIKLSAGHALWICGLNLLWPYLLLRHPSFGVVTTIFVVGISGWLLFTPGNPAANRYGLRPEDEPPEPDWDRVDELEWAS